MIAVSLDVRTENVFTFVCELSAFEQNSRFRALDNFLGSPKAGGARTTMLSA